MSPTDHAEESEPEPGSSSDDGREGVEHLQRAAHEMIAAARSFLDVVEDVVGDSAAVASVADALATMGQAVARAGGRARSAAADMADSTGSSSGTGPDDGAGGSRVQHIDVS